MDGGASSSRAVPASGDTVACPSCSARLPYGVLNTHLDRCLAGDSAPPQAPPENVGGAAQREAAPARAKRDASPEAGASGASAPQSKRARANDVPFAEQMRPQTLDDFVGQTEIVQGTLHAFLKRGHVPSMVLWGPPGTGKTTLARLLTRAAEACAQREGVAATPYRFVEVSATLTTTNEVKRIIDESVRRTQLTSQRTVLFIDEIQRFNRAQQDVFLHAVERGQIVLIAATTENPSFRLQAALLSRMR